MREISAQLLRDEQHMSPVLRMEKLNRYTFNTPNDGGTGAQYRGVITFDLANMDLSPLPFIIHDMQMLLHIEKKASWYSMNKIAIERSILCDVRFAIQR